MDRAKVLDKIQKCLALSKSPNEHEAAAALRQAQKLMEKHGITDADLGAIGYGSEKVDTTIQVGKGRRNKKTGTYTPPSIPVALAFIVDLMERAFCVRPVYGADRRKTDLNWNVTYYGREDRVLLAAYAHTVVARAVDAAWRDYLTVNPHYRQYKGGRAGFYIGWIKAVSAQVESLAMTDEERAATDLVLRREGVRLSTVSTTNQRFSSNAANAGASAGESFKLHRPVNVDKLRLEDKS